MSATRLNELYRPTHDERARQNFVGALKGIANGPMEEQLAQRYVAELEPAYQREHGHAPRDRSEGKQAFETDPLFKLWSSVVYTSQDLMWQTVDETCQRVLPGFVEKRKALETAETGGQLELAPELELPEPIRSVEIHRQPGGYFGEFGDYALLTGLRYFGTVELYRAAKGLATGKTVGEPGIGHFIVNSIKKRFGDISPAAVLDLGCGTGVETVAYKQSYPDAKVSGVDLSAPLLNFAHVWTEDAGLDIDWRQADARATGYADESFDLIVSNIMFHETWFDIVPAIMAEAKRLLKPGGIFLNADTAYQPQLLNIPKQVSNDWQVTNNGEPFWTGYADLDMREQLIEAGFTADQVFADYDPLGQGQFHIFGARKDES